MRTCSETLTSDTRYPVGLGRTQSKSIRGLGAETSVGGLIPLFHVDFMLGGRIFPFDDIS